MHLSDIQVAESQENYDFGQADEQMLALCLAGEIGEVCNEIKKYLRGDFGWLELVEKMKSELPDIQIYLVMLANAVDVELETEYHRKRAYNERRFGSPAATE